MKRELKNKHLGKIEIYLNRGDPRHYWHDVRVETMWVEHICDNIFILKNIPFYACGLAYGDIVNAKPKKNENDKFIFQVIYRHSGGSTIRILKDMNTTLEKFEILLNSLAALRCTFEKSTEFLGLYAFDIPRGADYHEITRILDAAEASGVAVYEEGKKMHE